MADRSLTDGTIELADGRSLGVREVGAADGVPVILCHGAPGSRQFVPADDALAHRLGVRLVTVDRPGYGTSTRQRGRVVHSWSLDVDELADRLGLDRFGVVGWSGGAAFALATAEALRDRVLGVAVVSPLGPFDDDDAPDHLGDRRLASVVRVLRSRHVGTRAAAALAAFALRKEAARRAADAEPDADPDGTATAPATAPAMAVDDADREVLGRPAVHRVVVHDMRAAFAQGVTGWADDVAALVKPWAVDYRRLTGPVTMWHGTADPDVAPAAAEALVELVPGAVLHLVPGGHQVIHDLWPAVLTTAADGSGRREAPA